MLGGDTQVISPAKKLEDLIRLAELCVDLLRQNEEFYAEVIISFLPPLSQSRLILLSFVTNNVSGSGKKVSWPFLPPPLHPPKSYIYVTWIPYVFFKFIFKQLHWPISQALYSWQIYAAILSASVPAV